MVDDSEVNIEVLRLHLDGAGFEVISASSGLEAFGAASDQRPDMVLLDIMMPGVSGFEVCKALKNDPLLEHIPVVFVSAKGDPESLIKGFGLGAADYILRPFAPEELHARLQLHLGAASGARPGSDQAKASAQFARGLRRAWAQMPPIASDRIHAVAGCRAGASARGDVARVASIGPNHLLCYTLEVEGESLPSTLLAATIHSLLAPEPDRGLPCRTRAGALQVRSPADVARILHQAFPPERTGLTLRFAYAVVDLVTVEVTYALRGVDRLFRIRTSTGRGRALSPEPDESGLRIGSFWLSRDEIVVLPGPGLARSAQADGRPFCDGGLPQAIGAYTAVTDLEGLIDAVLAIHEQSRDRTTGSADAAMATLHWSPPR